MQDDSKDVGILGRNTLIIENCGSIIALWQNRKLHKSYRDFFLTFSILLRWGLLADRYGLPIRGCWQTVTVC